MSDLFTSLGSAGMTAVAFVLVLGLLVFVHELGHFAVAKWAGIRVEEFGFGFPPRMFTLFKRGETEYTINWLPLGGFVRMIGENGEDASDPRSFASKSRAWRAAVLMAGSAMNLLLPVLIFTVIAMVGVPEGPSTGRIEVVGVEPGSPAAEIGLQSGDEIIFAANQRVTSIDRLVMLVNEFKDREITLDVEREGELQSFTVVPRQLDETPQARIGVAIINQQEIIRLNPFSALAWGVRRTYDLLMLMLVGFGELIGSLFSGSAESAAITGPLGIAQATGEVARTGVLNLFNFAAYLSINLAIVNMLPIPALDGGRLLFVLLEALRGGKRISPEREGLVHLLGMLLLLGLMAFISVFDLQRIAGGGSILQ